MRIALLVTILGFVHSFNLEGKDVNGMIIYENKTLHVTFDFPVKPFSQVVDSRRIQSKIKYYNPSEKKITIRPDEAKEIRF